MKITELVGGRLEEVKDPVYSILDGFSVWTTRAERDLLEKIQRPIKLSSLTEQEQFTIQAMIRKSLVTKIGQRDPSVVANERTN